MKEVTGTYNTAKVFTDIVDEYSLQQIELQGCRDSERDTQEEDDVVRLIR